MIRDGEWNQRVWGDTLRRPFRPAALNPTARFMRLVCCRRLHGQFRYGRHRRWQTFRPGSHAAPFAPRTGRFSQRGIWQRNPVYPLLTPRRYLALLSHGDHS